MSPQRKIAARYIAQSPDDVALYSMRLLAAKAEVSPNTMLRLAKHLGFADYNSFRDEVRARVREQVDGGPFATRARQLQAQRPHGATVGPVNEVFALDLKNLQKTIGNHGPDDIDTLIDPIGHAKRVCINGSQYCTPEQ